MKKISKSTSRPGLFINNSRFYILVLSLLFSIIVACYLRLNITTDTLYFIRTQQVFGFIALLLWYFALLATPLSGVFGKSGWMAQYLYARRALGVSATYFALLHVLIGTFGQLGGISNLLVLPTRFQQALVFGLVGLVVLLAMTATSFDKAIKWITFPRWKWLHRLSYPAVILVLLHTWIIGTHLESVLFRSIIFGAITILVILESWRVTKNIEKASNSNDPKLRMLVFGCLVIISVGLAFYVPYSIDSYHANHKDVGGHR